MKIRKSGSGLGMPSNQQCCLHEWYWPLLDEDLCFICTCIIAAGDTGNSLSFQPHMITIEFLFLHLILLQIKRSGVWSLEFFHICKQSVDCLLQLTFYLLNLDIFQAARGKSYHYISSYHHTFHSTSVSSLDSCKHCIWHYCDKTPIAFMGDILAEKDA